MGRKKVTIGNISFDLINHIILALLVVATIYPFYYILIYSISDPSQAAKGITFLPRGLSLENYSVIFRLRGLNNAAFISLARTISGTVLTVASCSFFAYLVTKQELLFRKVIYRFVVISMYLNAGFIPWYLTMRSLGLKNNFLLYILPGAVTAFNVILVKTFIEQLPAALEESARIDGAGYITIFVKIIFPLSKPIIATIAIFAAVGQWNAWTDNYFLVQAPHLKTLQLILWEYLSQTQSLAQQTMEQLNQQGAVKITPMGVRMTVTMVVTLPILFVYPLMQRHFVKGLMLGAIKG